LHMLASNIPTGSIVRTATWITTNAGTAMAWSF